MSNQRSPNEDIQKVSDMKDRLIFTTFKEATGWTYYYRHTATFTSNQEVENAEDVVASSNEANEEKSSLFYSDIDQERKKLLQMRVKELKNDLHSKKQQLIHFYM